MLFKRLACPTAIAAIATCALLPTRADAGFYSGSELYEICTTPRSDKSYVERSYECVAYITGAFDAFNTTREVNSLKSCIPADVTISRLRDVTVDWLDSNPDQRGKSASALVFAATRKAWPCPGQNTRQTRPAKKKTTKKR